MDCWCDWTDYVVPLRRVHDKIVSMRRGAMARRVLEGWTQEAATRALWRRRLRRCRGKALRPKPFIPPPLPYMYTVSFSLTPDIDSRRSPPPALQVAQAHRRQEGGGIFPRGPTRHAAHKVHAEMRSLVDRGRRQEDGSRALHRHVHEPLQDVPSRLHGLLQPIGKTASTPPRAHSPTLGSPCLAFYTSSPPFHSFTTNPQTLKNAEP